MFKPINETEDLLPSSTKNCKKIRNQTHSKAKETLESKLTKSTGKVFRVFHLFR